MPSPEHLFDFGPLASALLDIARRARAGPRVGDAMSRRVVAVAADTRAEEAARTASGAGVQHLIVLHPAGDSMVPVGVLCLCDLREADPRSSVWPLMSVRPITIHPDSTLEDAVRTMKSYGIGFLPVVLDDGVVGVVTRGDLRRAGLPDAQAVGRRCSACRTHHHVRRNPALGHASFCVECMDAVRNAEDEELGVGD